MPSPNDPRAMTLQAGEIPTLELPGSQVESSGASSEEISRHTLGVGDVEGMLAAGEHKRVCELLGPADRAAALPAPLGLVYIAARGEVGSDSSDLPHLAVHTAGALLGADPSSHGARLVAKLFLGLNAAAITRRTPKAPLRLELVGAALALGVVLGVLIGALLF
jgi:hypothetical protein